MRTIQTKFFWGLLLSVLSLTSCISDRFDDETGGASGKDAVQVKFALQMPNGNAAGTYAITEIDENEVTTIDVLAFIPVTANAEHPSGYAFAYKAQVSGASIVSKPGYSKNEVKEFTVTLQKKTETQNFVLLANVRDQVDALGNISVGADKDELLKQLVFANAGSWNANNGKADNAADKTFLPFPMWGEVSRVINDATTQITDGKLLRGIARLDVVLGDNVLSAANFYLEKLYIYNSKNKARIVPDAANISSGKATAATPPTGSINNDTPLVYEIPEAMKNAFERSVYLFEAKAVAQDKSSEATCIVIGGRFGSDTQTSYYRLDFFQADNKTYKDVLRNHHYRVNITKVDGRGEGSPEEAFNSKASNMEAQVIEWNDGDFGTVTFDGQHYLSVSPAIEFDFPRAGGTQPVYLKTDVPEGWQITKITEADGTTTNTGWLTTDKTTGSFYGMGEVKVAVNISVTENTSNANRVGYIYVQAGRLETRLTVRQGITNPASLDITSGGSSITELVFTDLDLGPKTLDVSWFPQDADLQITNSSIAGYNVFPTSSGIPSTGIVAGGNGGTGQISYAITATALTAAEIAANPFIEKVSKLSFLVTNGFEDAYKSVLIRHGNYALTHDLNTGGYLLDNSKTHTITIKSNSSWKVASITGAIEILDTPTDELLSQHGGNNTTTGDALTFKLITDDSNSSHSGKSITITLTDPTGKVPDTILVVKGVSCGTNGTAVLRRIGNNDYLTHLYGTGDNQRCWMVQNSMEGTANSIAYGRDGNGNTFGVINSGSQFDGQTNGYYYGSSLAVSACPVGWHLPTSAEVNTLVSEVNVSRNTNPVSKWWCGVQGVSNSAFAGYSYYSTYWHRWKDFTVFGDWWYDTGTKYMSGNSNSDLIAPSNNINGTNLLLSVRCVQDQ